MTLFACYLVDVRDDAGDVGKDHNLQFHRHVIKLADKSLPELIEVGKRMLSKHPHCNRITIVGSGKKMNTKWLYDSANKIPTVDLSVSLA
jgi:hypothetical protein